MQTSRRRALQTVGASMVSALVAGCMGGDDASEPDTASPEDETPQPDDTPELDDSVLEHTTVPLGRASDGRPAWHDDEATTGRAFLLDDAQRQDAVLQRYDPPENRREELGDLLEDVDYETDRLVVVESVGPNACYSEMTVENVRRDGDVLGADVKVVDTSEADEMCAQVVTRPVTLLSVTFEGTPPDEVGLSVTDGWGEQSTVTASADDPLSPDPANLDGHVQPDDEAEPVESLACPDEGFERHYQGFDEANAARGEMDGDGEPGLAMRVAETSYDHGDTVEIRLVTVGDASINTGNRHKFNLQVYTDDGWQDVRGADEGTFPYTDEAVHHPPGEGFEWAIELTESGVVDASGTAGDLRVCPELPAGRYRFSYWGVIGDGAIAVEFDLED